MLTGIKIFATGLATLAVFYGLLFAFFASLLGGKGTVAAIIFYGAIFAAMFGLAAMIGAAFGL